MMNKWTEYDYKYEDSGNFVCICGKKNIKHLHFLRHTVNGQIIIVGSECINQFGSNLRDLELMNLEERGLGAEFVMRDQEVVIYRLIKVGRSRKAFLDKCFPKLIDNNCGFIAVEDRDAVLVGKDQVAHITGQLCLKPADPDHKSSHFLIVSFDRKDFKKDEIMIYGKEWTMSPLRTPHLAQYKGTCPVCNATFIEGKTSIIPCIRTGRQKKWICSWHEDSK